MDNAQNTDVVEVKGDEESDLLESISDPDELREIAKKRGHAYGRVKGELDELKKAPKPEPQSFVTKEDFYKSNEKKAKELLAVSESPEDKEIAENFDDIFTFYKDRSGRETEGAIIKDLRTARAAWRYENPPKDTTAEDATRELKGTVQKGRSAPIPSSVDLSSDKFSKPKGVDEWYPKKEEE